MPTRRGSQRTWDGVARELRGLINSGTYPIGSKLPTKSELASQYKTSGATIQRAMDQLTDEGFVAARPGLGWFACRPVRIALLRSSAHWHERNAQVRRSERDGWQNPVVTRTVRMLQADRRVAGDLRVPIGTRVCRRERRVRNGGRVLHLGRSFLPEAITRNTLLERVESLKQGTYELLAQHGHFPIGISETVSVGAATEHESAVLGLDAARSPMVIRINRIVHGTRGPLEADYLTARMGELRLEYELPLPGPTNGYRF